MIKNLTLYKPMSQPMWNPLEGYFDRLRSRKSKTLASDSNLIDSKQRTTQRETIRWEELIGHK